jgi:3-methylcrotonyl-CoA carboxylase alpha subunit
MFDKLLVANRGEIACRIMRTARRLGIRTVAVYSDADAHALHVELADEAVAIGPAPARESYLDGAKIIAAAQMTGARVIHPGYGFLSENADFAAAVVTAGLVFVGPPAAAIRAMGSKSEAKALMERAKVPVVPGYHGRDQSHEMLTAAAGKIGYPVLLKPSAGGGGKGMRRVDEARSFAAALASARREAESAFGDSRMIVEKYVLDPRHIEFQVFADNDGHALHLYERDCSIQRRHQKIIEEAPASGLTGELRREMGEAAVAAVAAVGYVGAGTIEFILDCSDKFYFMEMNTRLQVEHPVTEFVTGLDLVEWQLRIAAGEALPLRQGEVRINGHAVEVRIYAEDPTRDFLPSTGRIFHFALPPDGIGLRTDTGIRAGDEVTIHYDPMLAKLIVWDEDRQEALRRLALALGQIEIAGVATNTGLLRKIVTHPAFIVGDVATSFIERHSAELLASADLDRERLLAAAAGSMLLQQQDSAEQAARSSTDPHSPWHATDGWRLNLEARREFRFKDRGAEQRITVHLGRNNMSLDLGAGPRIAKIEKTANGRMHISLGGRRFDATVIGRDGDLTVFCDGMMQRLEIIDPLAAAEAIEAPSGQLTAPMPGRVVQLHVEAGRKVKRGEVLLVLEAMKMEHNILAPADGVIEEVGFTLGDLVEEGVPLLSLAIEDDK